MIPLRGNFGDLPLRATGPVSFAGEVATPSITQWSYDVTVCEGASIADRHVSEIVVLTVLAQHLTVGRSIDRRNHETNRHDHASEPEHTQPFVTSSFLLPYHDATAAFTFVQILYCCRDVAAKEVDQRRG